ncbi:hypothetical protein DAMA08_022900 [Martiniozyma asiatica (nom. inval.)]|nr:hypothetical protein DAMA08_022900 [Martiniozyma asiatica]
MGPKRKITINPPKLVALYTSIIDELMEMTDPSDPSYKLVSPFLELPSKEYYADYYDIVDEPTCIEDIKKKGNISTDEFLNCWRLMRDNAEKYNGDGTQIVADAESLLKHVESRINEYKSKDSKKIKKVKIEPATIDFEATELESDGNTHEKFNIPKNVNVETYINDISYYSDDKSPDGDFTLEIEKLLKSLISYKNSHHKNSLPLARPFMKLPDPNEAIDSTLLSMNSTVNNCEIDPITFYTYLEHPVTFDIIQGKLEGNLYIGERGIERFGKDLQLLFKIIDIYKENSAIWKCATGLYKLWEKKWPKLWSMVGQDIVKNLPEDEENKNELQEQEEVEEPQWIRKHEIKKADKVSEADDITAFMKSVILKSVSLTDNGLSEMAKNIENGLPINGDDVFSFQFVEPAGNSTVGGSTYFLQLPNEVVNQDLHLNVTAKGTLMVKVNGESLQQPTFRLGSGLNLLEISLQINVNRLDIIETCNVWIDISN